MNFKINSRPLFTIIFKLRNDNFKTRDFSPLIGRFLAGVGRNAERVLERGPHYISLIERLVTYFYLPALAMSQFKSPFQPKVSILIVAIHNNKL